MEKNPDDLYNQILNRLSEMKTDEINTNKELFSNQDGVHLTNLNSRKVKEFLETKDNNSEDKHLEDIDDNEYKDENDIEEDIEESKDAVKSKCRTKKQKEELSPDAKKTRKLLKMMVPIQLILLLILLYLLYTKIYDTTKELDIFPQNDFEIENHLNDSSKEEDDKNEDNTEKTNDKKEEE